MSAVDSIIAAGLAKADAAAKYPRVLAYCENVDTVDPFSTADYNVGGALVVPGLIAANVVLPKAGAVDVSGGGWTLRNSTATGGSMLALRDATGVIAANGGVSTASNELVPIGPLRRRKKISTAPYSAWMTLGKIYSGSAQLLNDPTSPAWLAVSGLGTPSIFASFGSARAVAAESDWYIEPADYARDGTATAVVYCHGAGGTATTLGSNFAPNELRLIQAIGAKYPLAVCDLGGDQWGNATHMSRITSAITWLQSSWGAKAGKVLLVGHSMGGLGALNYFQQNPNSVKAVAAISPVADLNDVYNNNRGGYQASIATAYGVTAPAALPAGSNPTTTNSNLTGKPIRFWHSSADAIATPATVSGLATTIGATDTIVSSTATHGEQTFGAVDPVQVLAFLAANA